MSVSIELDGAFYERLIEHLLRPDADDEEAAFLFAQPIHDGASTSLVVRDEILLPPDAFAFRSPEYLELTDETRAMLIKRAHDLSASLIEVHSHPKYTAQFSWSDKRGLREFVPHVWWRLRGRPYAALVVAPRGFDALVWIRGPQVPEKLDALIVNGARRQPSGLTLSRWGEEDENVGKSF
jgi:proteasome lid subunit RPN8/RPN11